MCINAVDIWPLTENDLCNRKNFSFWAWSGAAVNAEAKKKNMFLIGEMNWVVHVKAWTLVHTGLCVKGWAIRWEERQRSVAFISVCSWCQSSETRLRQTWGSQCTGPGPGSPTWASSSPPSQHPREQTDLEREEERRLDPLRREWITNALQDVLSVSESEWITRQYYSAERISQLFNRGRATQAGDWQGHIRWILFQSVTAQDYRH